MCALPFKKMHGLGNDFVIIDGRGQAGPSITPDTITSDFIKEIADRNRGVGFDQLALLMQGDTDESARVRFYNSDGTPSAACGNATRCIVRLLLEETGRETVTVDTEKGLMLGRRKSSGAYQVNMGHPVTVWHEIPLDREVDDMDNLDLDLPKGWRASAVSMGNPHCVLFTNRHDLDDSEVESIGKRLEHDPLFPERANVEFVREDGPERLRVRVWERGAGLTLACGTGACAAAVAARRKGMIGRSVEIALDGGLLGIDLKEDGVWMSGPTTYVFDGNYMPDGA